MLFWKPNGDVSHVELYDVGEDPTEEGRDLADTQPEQAEAMKSKLLAFLDSVSAETPQDNPKKKRNNRAKK